MTSKLKQPQRNPSLPEAIKYAIMSNLAGVNTGIVGSVTKYDKDKDLAEIQIEVSQLMENGEQLVIPPLFNVPILRERTNGGKSYLSLPIKKGDKGWVMFSQRTIDNWLVDGKQQDMNNLRMFDMSDAIFSPGIYPSSKTLSENNEDVVLRHEDTHITLKKDGLLIEDKNGNTFEMSSSGVSINGGNLEVLK